MRIWLWTCIRHAIVAAGTLAAISVSPTLHAQERAVPTYRQFAQSNHWLVGNWVWASEWGPVTFIVKGIDANGRPIGRLENRRYNAFRDCDEKAGAATMICTLTGSKFHIQFSTGEYQLSLSGNALVGRYSSGQTVRNNVNFVKQ